MDRFNESEQYRVGSLHVRQRLLYRVLHMSTIVVRDEHRSHHRCDGREQPLRLGLLEHVVKLAIKFLKRLRDDLRVTLLTASREKSKKACH